MDQLSRHGRVAREYWETYRPQALEDLGSVAEQNRYFQELDSRVVEMIGTLAQTMLQEVPLSERGAARPAVRQQAQEIVYAQEIYLPKELGTEHREI